MISESHRDPPTQEPGGVFISACRIGAIVTLGLLAACGNPANSPLPATSPSPPEDSAGAATTAIVAAKATSGAEMVLTLTALPPLTPTPTVPAGARPCYASDLEGEASAEGATGSKTR